jgi:hypothetical protein
MVVPEVGEGGQLCELVYWPSPSVADVWDCWHIRLHEDVRYRRERLGLIIENSGQSSMLEEVVIYASSSSPSNCKVLT